MSALQKQIVSLQKQIVSLQKQNDGIYSSLVNKGIEFNRVEIPTDNLISISEEEHLRLLKNENSKLKELANQHKPPPQVKEPKPDTKNPDKSGQNT